MKSNCTPRTPTSVDATARTRFEAVVARFAEKGYDNEKIERLLKFEWERRRSNNTQTDSTNTTQQKRTDSTNTPAATPINIARYCGDRIASATPIDIARYCYSEDDMAEQDCATLQRILQRHYKSYNIKDKAGEITPRDMTLVASALGRYDKTTASEEFARRSSADRSLEAA